MNEALYEQRSLIERMRGHRKINCDTARYWLQFVQDAGHHESMRDTEGDKSVSANAR
ncbi:hypothetical protein [Sphingobium yanoikuyae]|jgi:hypothetical protein|uniref:hypothetical protein n=1 Tax=Sphingobium yanoikuyae TaxID=13690 RepID=UPI00241E63BF|nr:hypothetical protein [Sphingobium yanoikuyae]